MNKRKCFKGFTLMEILIALTVIGIITAIILPVGLSALPDKKVLKFKKAHNTLTNIIKNLAST